MHFAIMSHAERIEEASLVLSLMLMLILSPNRNASWFSIDSKPIH
jgi:hypothetical protein